MINKQKKNRSRAAEYKGKENIMANINTTNSKNML